MISTSPSVHASMHSGAADSCARSGTWKDKRVFWGGGDLWLLPLRVGGRVKQFWWRCWLVPAAILAIPLLLALLQLLTTVHFASGWRCCFVGFMHSVLTTMKSVAVNCETVIVDEWGSRASLYPFLMRQNKHSCFFFVKNKQNKEETN